MTQPVCAALATNERARLNHRQARAWPVLLCHVLLETIAWFCSCFDSSKVPETVR